MKGFFVVLFLLGIQLTAGAQADPVYHAIDKNSWEKAVEGLDYSEKEPERKELNDLHTKQAPTPGVVSPLLQIIGFALIALLLIFILIRIFGKGVFGNKKNNADAQARIFDLDERPMETDLERFLREALANKDYRLAIRIYYLMLLKTLNDKDLIVWKKNKTNMDYLREMQKHPDYAQLNRSTILFEFIWYGDTSIGEVQYNNISNSFISLIKQMNNAR